MGSSSGTWPINVQMKRDMDNSFVLKTVHFRDLKNTNEKQLFSVMDSSPELLTDSCYCSAEEEDG